MALDSVDIGLWYDDTPSEVRGAVCEVEREGETRPTTVETMPPGGSCAEGWQQYGNDCYKVYPLVNHLT